MSYVNITVENENTTVPTFPEALYVPVSSHMFACVCLILLMQLSMPDGEAISQAAFATHLYMNQLNLIA